MQTLNLVIQDNWDKVSVVWYRFVGLKSNNHRRWNNDNMTFKVYSPQFNPIYCNAFEFKTMIYTTIRFTFLSIHFKQSSLLSIDCFFFWAVELSSLSCKIVQTNVVWHRLSPWLSILKWVLLLLLNTEKGKNILETTGKAIWTEDPTAAVGGNMCPVLLMSEGPDNFQHCEPILLTLKMFAISLHHFSLMAFHQAIDEVAMRMCFWRVFNF